MHTDEAVGAMEAMVVLAPVGFLNQALVLVMVGQEDCMLVGEVMVAVVVTILMQDRFITKLS